MEKNTESKKSESKNKRANDIFIIMPAYNEEKSIGNVIRDLKDAGYKNIIVVDDGSRDRTAEIAKKEKVVCVQHCINRGLGGALGTGIQAALRKNADIIVTFDADGQHAVSDIKRVIKPIENKMADVVIGSRTINAKGMPLSRRIGNWALNFFTYFLFGIFVSDSQSGLRAFSRKAAEKIRIYSNTMEVSSEIIREIAENRLRLKEVPIKAIYTDYSLRKGQKFLNGFKIMQKLLVSWWMR